MTLRAALCGVALALLTPADLHARPDLRRPTAAGPLTVYPDDARGGVFYYAPGDLQVAAAADGRPELTFLHVRYTGSVTTGDRGREIYRSLLTFTVTLSGPAAPDLAAARLAVGKAAELRPMPIRRLETVLVYTPIDTAVEAAAAPGGRTLEGGHAEPADGAADSFEQYWSERVYSLLLGPDDAQLLAEALERGRVAISLGYAFYADGVPPGTPIDELRGTPELVRALRASLEKTRAAADAGPEASGGAPVAHLVRAGAVAVHVDTTRWPDVLRKIDAGASAPPGYAFLDVYCYDFNNELRADLYEKQVEIDAEGVTGRRARLVALFQKDSPDVYVRTLRFPVAVRLDRPYRYRIVEIRPDGTVREGGWRVRDSWARHLDVTGEAAAGGGVE